MKKSNILIICLILVTVGLNAKNYLGIFPGPMSIKSEKGYGIQVYQIKKGSPAAEAGVMQKDIILKMDNEKVYTADQYYKMLSLKEIGEQIKFQIERDSEKKTIKVVVADWKKFGKPYLGIYPSMVSERFKEDSNYDKNYGILIVNIVEDGPVAEAGIKSETIIMEIEGDKVFTSDQLLMMLKNYKPDQKIRLKTFYDEKIKDVDVTLGVRSDNDFLSKGIDFFNQPNNIFMYKYSDDEADSLHGKAFEFIINGEEIRLPNMGNILEHLEGIDNFWEGDKFDLKLDNIDFKKLENMEIIINGKTLKLPDNIKDMDQESLEKLIEEQIGDDGEHNIEIKILKTGEIDEVESSDNR